MIAAAVAGLALGASYALLATGFTVVFGVLRRIDLAYGASIMLGLYAAIWLHREGMAGAPALAPVVIAVTVLAAAYVERLCFAPHADRPPVTAMAASFAIWMQLQEIAVLALPLHTYPFPSPFAGAWPAGALGGIRPEHVLALVAAAAIGLGLARLLGHTRFGLAVRATTENRAAAACAGIDTRRVAIAVFGLAAAIGGVAGYLIACIDGQVAPHFAMRATLDGIAAAILGGLGSIPGAIAGGLLLGLVEAAARSAWGPQQADLARYGLLLAVLAAAPGGLAGIAGAARRRLAARRRASGRRVGEASAAGEA
ncbi:MAG: branched-chain amino acid ABC transporter permease [Azospirillaceae bacterium]